MEKAFQFEEVNDLLFGEVLTGETVGPRDPAMEGIEDKEAQVKRCRTKQRECTLQPSGTGHASQRFFYREVGSQ